MDVHIIILQGLPTNTITNAAPTTGIGFNHPIDVGQAKMLII